MKTSKRRTFLKQTGMLYAGLLTARLEALTAPLTTINKAGNNIQHNQIDPAWVKSLYERGTVTTYLKSKNELQYIGMPVGGINTGMLYLGGDGRLWLWDIFNLNQEGVNPLDVNWHSDVHAGKKIRSRDGSAYVAPATSDEIRPLEQGFAIRIKYNGKTVVRKLCEADWQEVSFEATYPIGKIKYFDSVLPIEITMHAYSPFIPLDENKSGLPASIFSIEIKNNSVETVDIEVAGWLENKTAMYSAIPGKQMRTNAVYKLNNATGIYSTVNNMGGVKEKIEDAFDYGSLCLTALQKNSIAGTNILTANRNGFFNVKDQVETRKSIHQKLIGNVVSAESIPAGNISIFDFVISWHMPNLVIDNGKTLPKEDEGRYYANQFNNAKEVAEFIAANFNMLSSTTKLWQQTWYDSTLPYWFLERTFLNISSLATTTSHRFKSGRYWAWEGVSCCTGNCTHVWQYAQAVSRIFPGIEKDNRQRVDLGIAFKENGSISFRGEFDKRPAIDGQAGTVLRFYREHKMSMDASFLKDNWSNIKKTVQFVIDQDRNKDGMTDTPMENTLDAVWDGEIAWIVGLCIAGVKAGQMMAEEMKDNDFTQICKAYVDKGKKNMEEKLFNGEYFIHKPDAVVGRKKLGSYNTCHIDQVYGQSWAFQVGLDRIIEKEKTLMALRSLWKYNFKMDVGPYIKEHNGGGRPYALPGEGGMIMNTNPKNEDKPYGDNVTWQLGYFHECMSGFEHQVASHLIAEDMLDEGMILTRAIHDRYHAAKRNPFNEIECSDHYSRAMASYGSFISACGFDYHGPKGFIRFAPKWDKEHFKAPFTAAEGWGTYNQKIGNSQQEHGITLHYGTLKLSKFSVEKLLKSTIKSVSVKLDSQNVSASFKQNAYSIDIVMNNNLIMKTGQQLIINIK